MEKIEVMDAAILNEIASLWIRNNYVSGMAPTDIQRHIMWKYHPAYADVFVERFDGRVIGTMGFLKMTLWTKVGDLECRWGMDSLMNKAQRASHTGSFAKFRRAAFCFEDPSRQIGFCFPNDVVKDTYLKIGMRPVGNFAQYRFQLIRPRYPMSQEFSRRHALKDGLTFSWEVTFEDPAIGELCLRLRKSFSLLSNRDAAYLSWRYDACPTKRYRILVVRSNKVVKGFLVVRFSAEAFLKKCSIVDILCPPDDRGLIDKMLGEVERFCISQGVESIVISINHLAFVVALTDAGYIKEKKEDVFYWAKDESIHDMLQEGSQQLHITAGDGDYDME